MTTRHFSALAAIFLGVLTSGCHSDKAKAEDGAVFQVTSPVRSDTEITKKYVAQIHSIQHIELRALERGYLDGIFIDEGQTVKKGQRLFQVMPALYQAEFQKAQAEAEFASIEYRNTKGLADSNVVSPNELALSKAKLDKANAEMALAKVHRDFTGIKAPFEGIIDRFHVRHGSLVDEGELLSTLSDNSKMWVYFNVTEAEYLDYKSKLQAGDELAVKLLMANGKVFDQSGKVQTIEGEFNNETGTIAFRAMFPNPKGLLRHGETGSVLMTTPLKAALLIPQKATFEVLDKKYVFVIGTDNVVKTRQITIAEEMPQLYVVSEGLDQNDRILLDGLRKVKDGDKIATKFADPKEVIANLEVPAE